MSASTNWITTVPDTLDARGFPFTVCSWRTFVSTQDGTELLRTWMTAKTKNTNGSCQDPGRLDARFTPTVMARYAMARTSP